MRKLAEKSKKDTKWQIARGIAILCVILIHCPNAINSPQDSLDFNSWLILRQFINFPVALFFYIAGRFTNYSRYTNYKTFILNRGGVRLLIPFLIWSTFYGLTGVVKAAMEGEIYEVTVWPLILKILCGRTAPHLYYIVVLLQLTLLTPILLRFIDGRYDHVFYLLTPVWLIYIYCWSYSHGELPPLYHAVFPAWIGFYIWGIKSRNEVYERTLPPLYLIAIVIGFEISEAYFSLKFGFPLNFASSQIRISAFLYATMVIKIFTNWNCTGTPSMLHRWLAFIGDRSYGIYYLHYFFIQLSAGIVRRMHFNIMGISWIFKAVLAFAVALLGSLIVMQGGRKILNKIGMEKVADILGF